MEPGIRMRGGWREHGGGGQGKYQRRRVPSAWMQGYLTKRSLRHVPFRAPPSWRTVDGTLAPRHVPAAAQPSSVMRQAIAPLWKLLGMRQCVRKLLRAPHFCYQSGLLAENYYERRLQDGERDGLPLPAPPPPPVGSASLRATALPTKELDSPKSSQWRGAPGRSLPGRITRCRDFEDQASGSDFVLQNYCSLTGPESRTNLAPDFASI